MGLRTGFYSVLSSLIRVFLRILPLRVQVQIKQAWDIVVQTDIPGRFKIYADNEIELFVRAHSNAKEPEMQEWMKELFFKGCVFYDVGANIGAYSLMATLFAENVIVYAFEPHPANFAHLCMNIDLNECGNLIHPVNIALSYSNGRSRFLFSDIRSGSALHAIGAPTQAIGYFADVYAGRLDTLNFPAPSFLKIDTDGHELDILKGAGKMLADRALRSLMIEVNESLTETGTILAYLGRYGFSLKAKYPFKWNVPTAQWSTIANYRFDRV